MKTKILAQLIGLSFIMMSAGAALAAGMDTAEFDALDQNQDGQLSAEEVSQNPTLSEKWTEIDADASGTIDRSEFSAFESMDETPASDAPASDKPAE